MVISKKLKIEVVVFCKQKRKNGQKLYILKKSNVYGHLSAKKSKEQVSSRNRPRVFTLVHKLHKLQVAKYAKKKKIQTILSYEKYNDIEQVYQWRSNMSKGVPKQKYSNILNIRKQKPN